MSAAPIFKFSLTAPVATVSLECITWQS